MSRILIVDDYPGNRKLLRTALEAEGHDVVEAGDSNSELQETTLKPSAPTLSATHNHPSAAYQR